VVVAYYFPERWSRQAEQLMRGPRRPVISDLTEVEFMSALSRKARSRELRTADAARVTTEFLADLEAGLYRRLGMERRHFEQARDWISRSSMPLRTLDALHLAAAASHGLGFVTADEALGRSARALGLETVSLND
jgi:hypothetical protein